MAGSPDGAGHPRRTVLTLLAVLIGTVLPMFLLTSLAVQLRQALGFGVARLGVVLAVYFLVAALTSVPSGHLAERIGGARVLRAAGLLCGASLASVGVLVHSWTGLVISLACAGAAASAVQPAANLLLVELIPPQRQGVAFGVKQSAIPAGALLGGLAVPGIALTIGWRWAFVVAAVLTALATWWLPGGGPVRRAARPRADRDQPRRRQSSTKAPLLALIIFTVAFGLALIAASALAGFLVSSSVHSGLSSGTAGLIAALAGACSLVVRLIAGVLADRHQGNLFSPVAWMLLLGSAGYAGLAVSAGAHDAALIAPAAALTFGAGWGWNGLFNLAVVRAYPDAPAWATGVTQTGGRLGSMVGPIVFGFVAATTGYEAAWTIAAAAACASVVAMFTGRHLLAAHPPAGEADKPARAARSSPLPPPGEP